MVDLVRRLHQSRGRLRDSEAFKSFNIEEEPHGAGNGSLEGRGARRRASALVGSGQRMVPSDEHGCVYSALTWRTEDCRGALPGREPQDADPGTDRGAQTGSQGLGSGLQGDEGPGLANAEESGTGREELRAPRSRGRETREG